jgi:apolipoprotein N-acyltransferase
MQYKSFIEKLSGLTGFKKYLAAFGLGVLMTLTMPPIGLFPLFLIIVPGLATLSRSAPTRFKTFATGWAFGAGYFIFGLYWVSVAMFIDIAAWGWALPFSFILGPTVLALFYGFIPLLARPFAKNAAAHALALAAAWSFIEYLRGHILTGFPWILPGYAWDWALPVMQAAAVAGIYGLTLLTLCWGVLPLLGARKTLRHLFILSFVAVVMGGAVRLSVHETQQSGSHFVRIVQANIPLATKMDQDEDWRNIEKHMDLSAVKTEYSDNISFVVWPETTVVADLAQDQYNDIARVISMKMPPNAVGLLGAMRILEPSPGKIAYYNSLTAVGKKGHVHANYDKHHLVPFGEYMPFRHLLKLTPVSFAADMVGDFVPGPGPRTLRINSLPGVSPLVCYEAIFPGETVDKKDRADWMVNVTNDGWYGKTAGPHQHFAMTRMRAVEEGLPLARSANTGISGMIDPVGRVLGKLPLDTAGYVDTILPAPLPPTLYARFGDTIFFLMLALVAGIAIALRHKES